MFGVEYSKRQISYHFVDCLVYILGWNLHFMYHKVNRVLSTNLDFTEQNLLAEKLCY